MIDAVVLLHESAQVVEACLTALQESAPRRGIRVRVVDNASRDDGADRAASLLGESAVMRRDENLGFAAGVNAVLRGFGGEWLAVINPDVRVPRGALDGLSDVLASHPRAGLIGPRVRYPDGRPQRSTGRFPTLETEIAHAWMLDRIGGRVGRMLPFPRSTVAVDWVSGSAWLLRGDAIRGVGALDEGYFMYLEDVDYCRRLRDAGWDVLASPTVEVVHAEGQGSSVSAMLPADGGGAPLMRYLAKFEPGTSPERMSRTLVTGWRIRHAWHRVRSMLGDTRSRIASERYATALDTHAAASRAHADGSIDTPKSPR